MKRIQFIANASPLRALAEAYALGAISLLVLLSLQTELAAVVVQQGLFFIGAGIGVWTALRMRRPAGRWYRRVSIEFAVGGCAAAAAVVLTLTFRAALLSVAWVGTFFLLVGAIGFLCFRAGVGVWLFWDRLRRKRLIWSFTHAILTTVVVLALLFVVLLTLVSANYSPASELLAPEASPFASLAAQVLNRFLPLASIMVVFTVIGLALVLPPAIVFSYFVAHGLTKRLERLALATHQVQAGDYSVRIDAAGQDEIAQLQSDFNAMTTALDRSVREVQAERDRVAALLNERRELIASVSHELRTPVSTLRGYLESALSNWDTTPPETLRHDLTIMDRETDRLQTLIDDLFTLARAEVGQLTLVCQPIDLGALVQRVVDTLAPLAWQTSRVQVAAEVQSDVRAIADEGRLDQVLRNLIHNSLRHTPPGGIIAVITRLDHATATMEVRDTGEGIAPEDLPHVWERFYRSAQARQHDDGAGLGLALVKELIEAMGGAVSVTSKLGEGSLLYSRACRDGEIMTKADQYREALKTCTDWDAYLMQESGLPGPRGNLELAAVVADVATIKQIDHWLTFDVDRAPVNSPEEFLAFCGVVGLGRLIVEGQIERWLMLRRYASDPRWRTREGVAMALQRIGDADMADLLSQLEAWLSGGWLELRAVAAGLAEPKLLRDPAQIDRALSYLDRITAAIAAATDRRAEDYRVLRQGLGYCWSVIVAARPTSGKRLMERWLKSDDKDVQWVMRENLKKKRLQQVMDAAWVEKWTARLSK